MDLQDLRKGSIKDITAQLPELTADQLVELNALEAQDAAPRKGLLEAILAERNSRAPSPDEDEPAPPEPPAWQGDDYSGPLTADQAAWRHARIKPVEPARTK